MGLVNQLVTHGITSATLARPSMANADPAPLLAPGEHRRLIDVIAYEPEQAEREHLAQAEQLAAGRDHQQHRGRRDDDDRHARRAEALVARRHRRRQVAELADRLEHVVAADERHVRADQQEPGAGQRHRHQQRPPAVSLGDRRQQAPAAGRSGWPGPPSMATTVNIGTVTTQADHHQRRDDADDPPARLAQRRGQLAQRLQPRERQPGAANPVAVSSSGATPCSCRLLHSDSQSVAGT